MWWMVLLMGLWGKGYRHKIRIWEGLPGGQRRFGVTEVWSI